VPGGSSGEVLERRTLNAMNPPITVPYNNVQQVNEYWCWAAVASNVFNVLFPKEIMNQCQVATAAGQNCNLPNSFSLVAALNGNMGGPGLHIFHNKSTSVAKFFALIQSELGAQRPVSAEVDFATLTHFVAVTGADPAAMNVWVADPFPGGDSVEFAFEAFLENYYFMDGSSQGEQTGGVVEALIAVSAGSGQG
jgi:hypothetical protein